MYNDYDNDRGNDNDNQNRRLNDVISDGETGTADASIHPVDDDGNIEAATVDHTDDTEADVAADDTDDTTAAFAIDTSSLLQQYCQRMSKNNTESNFVINSSIDPRSYERLMRKMAFVMVVGGSGDTDTNTDTSSPLQPSPLIALANGAAFLNLKRHRKQEEEGNDADSIADGRLRQYPLAPPLIPEPPQQTVSSSSSSLPLSSTSESDMIHEEEDFGLQPEADFELELDERHTTKKFIYEHDAVAFLGFPYVYNIHNKTDLSEILRAARLAHRHRFASYIPWEYHPESMIQRVCHSILEEDAICTCPNSLDGNGGDGRDEDVSEDDRMIDCHSSLYIKV